MEGERKLLDIDAILTQGHLVLKLGGTEYIVNDVPIEDFLKATNVTEEDRSPEKLRDQLAMLLGTDPVNLKGIGIKGMSYALLEIKKWVTEPLGDIVPSDSHADGK